MRLAAWAADALDFLLPAGCLTCGAWLPGGTERSLLCGRCRTRLPSSPWPRCPRCHLPLGTGRPAGSVCRECADWPEALTRARHAHLLAPPADTLVHALKYEGWRELAREMGASMARAVRPALPASAGEGPVVVFIPTTVERERARGYNQAELLARSLARALDLRVAAGLVRARGGATQVSLHPSQRRANVKGAFRAREDAGSRIRGAHVLLVDDVLTTGATAGAAALELARMEASEITLVTYARALPFRRRTVR